VLIRKNASFRSLRFFFKAFRAFHFIWLALPKSPKTFPKVSVVEQSSRQVLDSPFLFVLLDFSTGLWGFLKTDEDR
jgi:hypothetical protein